MKDDRRQCAECLQEKSAPTRSWVNRKGKCFECFYTLPCRFCLEKVYYLTRDDWLQSKKHYALHDRCRQPERLQKMQAKMIGYKKNEMTSHEKKLYDEWATSVKNRDDRTCKSCKVEETDKSRHHAHHILRVHDHPFLCLVIDNGITLCETCHSSKSGVHGEGEPRTLLIEELRQHIVQ